MPQFSTVTYNYDIDVIRRVLAAHYFHSQNPPQWALKYTTNKHQPPKAHTPLVHKITKQGILLFRSRKGQDTRRTIYVVAGQALLSFYP